MQSYEKQFLQIISCAVGNSALPDGCQFDIGRVFSLSATHNIMPLVYDFLRQTDNDVSAYKKSVVRMLCIQFAKNTSFKSLFDELLNNNINVIVVKGPVCASCYSSPDTRLSSDFDIVVESIDENRLEEYFLSHGYEKTNGSYYSDVTGLYIEVSTQLGEGSDSLKKCADDVFDGFFDRAIFAEGYKTLCETDHIVYLLFHAYKHFIGSGIGIRQLVDIYLFLQKFSDNIDFDKMNIMLQELNILSFSANVFSSLDMIFSSHWLDTLKGCDKKYIHNEDFLSDVLKAGVFGKSSEDRLHSASIVLDAVDNSGKKNVFKTAFPDAETMKKRYPVLKKCILLLPLLWIYRLMLYAFRFLFGKKVSPDESLKIADERIGLMKKLGII